MNTDQTQPGVPEPEDDDEDRTIIAPIRRDPPPAPVAAEPEPVVPEPVQPQPPHEDIASPEPVATEPEPAPSEEMSQTIPDDVDLTTPPEPEPVEAAEPVQAEPQYAPAPSAPEVAPIPVPPGAPEIPQAPPPAAAHDDFDDEATIIVPPSGSTAMAPGPDGDLPPPPTTLEPGTIINDLFIVGQPLNQGGMGRVFRGEEKGTGESVAIKVILPEIADEEKFAAMFRDEARTLRQLHHDAIVRYFTYVPPNAAFNAHALVMGFIEGITLAERLKTQGELSVLSCCTLFGRLAGGLQAAHDLGVVHRDLSPDNVMLPGDQIEKAVLIDFGIAQSAKITDSALGDDFAGKLKYASPEQIDASAGAIDARSDIYSMALLMYITCTGQAAPMGKNMMEAIEARKSIPELSGAPVVFRELFARMLQPDPSQRLASMRELKQALENISNGRDPFAAPTEVTSRMEMTNRPTEGLQAAPNLLATTGTLTKPSGEKGEIADEPEPEEKSGGLVKALAALVLVGAIGGGAYVFLGQGDQGTTSDTTVEAENNGPARLEGSRQAFLAETAPAGCAFATLRGHGPNAGFIEGFRGPNLALNGITDQFATAFGSSPTLLDRPVSDAQCAALTIARTFQGTAGSGMELTLAANELPRSESIIGTVHGSAGRSDWLGVITPSGRVFALTSQFEDPIGDERRFGFRLPSAQPGVYLLVALASSKALVRAGAMQDGTEASAIFDLISRELAQDPQGAVDVGFIRLTN